MVPAEAHKILIGSKQSVPMDKTLKVALLSILNNVEGNSAKSNVFGSSKRLKAIAVEYLIFQKFFGLWGFNRSFSYFDLEWHIHILFTAWILECYDLRTSKMSIEHVFTAYFHLALNEEPSLCTSLDMRTYINEVEVYKLKLSASLFTYGVKTL